MTLLYFGTRCFCQQIKNGLIFTSKAHKLLDRFTHDLISNTICFHQNLIFCTIRRILSLFTSFREFFHFSHHSTFSSTSFESLEFPAERNFWLNEFCGAKITELFGIKLNKNLRIFFFKFLLSWYVYSHYPLNISKWLSFLSIRI